MYLELEIRRVFCLSCNKVKQEKLEFLADNPFYTKALPSMLASDATPRQLKTLPGNCAWTGRPSRNSRSKYLREKLRHAGKPCPKVIGIDEISIRKGHSYRIVVSDLERKRAIWFGGKDRSEESMNLFYSGLGLHKTKKIRLAVMDMWKAFENATRCHAPQAAILYDKFHVIRHLNDALDKVRKSEYARLSGKDRKFIKGSEIYPPLSS